MWIYTEEEYILVDYKSTSKKERITRVDLDWQTGYRRQMEVYQWLLRKNGCSVSNAGYFVYCNEQTNREMFQGKLEFDITVIPYEGNDSWVETTIKEVNSCLIYSEIPDAKDGCGFCAYRTAIDKVCV